jgi:hypothetical protein
MHRYTQFPLCFLAFGSDVRSRLESLVSWCALDVGAKFSKGLKLDEISSKLEVPSPSVVVLEGTAKGFLQRTDMADLLKE